MTTIPSKLVLLDFDGVLNDNAHIRGTETKFPGVQIFTLELGSAMLDPVRCARIQRICDVTGAGILLVTGWRRLTQWQNLAEILKGHGITAPVVGAVAGVKMSGDLRADASREWLDKNRHVTRYVVIDDDIMAWDGFGKKKPWKDVAVHPTDGIEDDHVDRAIAILNREAV